MTTTAPLRRSRSVTPQLPLTPNPSPSPSSRSKSATKSRPLGRRPKENRRRPSPCPERPKPVTVSAWALSPGRAPTPTIKAPGVQRGGALKFLRRRREPSAREEAVHEVRVLVGRLIQWRFVNAKAAAAAENARSIAERKLFYTWLRINELRNVVAAKTMIYQRRRLKMKLIQILNPQIWYLSQCESVSKSHLEAVTTLERVLGAICLSVPLVDGVEVNMLSVCNYICEAMDTIGDIETAIGIFYSEAEHISSLLCEMANIMQQEMQGLEELVKTRKTITSTEMHEISLRVSLMQALKEGIYGYSNQFKTMDFRY